MAASRAEHDRLRIGGILDRPPRFTYRLQERALHMRQFAHRFGADRRGVAAIEFALLLPVMILLYFGSAEFVNAFSAQRRISHIAASIADITAQDRTISTAQLNDLFAG